MAIKAVIFDLDGTITEQFLNFPVIRAEMGLTADDPPILEALEKMPADRKLVAMQILDRHEKIAIEKSALNRGAKQILHNIRQRGIFIGILTRNTRENARAVAVKHGLEFDAIFDRYDGPVKPDPFGVLSLCAGFGVLPAETLVVGDYLFDMMCAKNAGAVSVLLKSHADADKFLEWADYAIDTLSEIENVLEMHK